MWLKKKAVASTKGYKVSRSPKTKPSDRTIIVPMLKYILVLALATNGFAEAPAKELPKWESSPEVAYKLAAQAEKPILVLFTGPEWCGPCRFVEAKIFNKPEFAELIEGEFVLLKWNVPHPNTAEGAKAAQTAFDQFQVQAYPTVVILSPQKTTMATLHPTRLEPTPEAFVEAVKIAYAHALVNP